VNLEPPVAGEKPDADGVEGSPPVDGGESRLVRFAASAMLVGVAASLELGLANVVLGAAFIAWLAALARRQLKWRPAMLHLPVAAYLAASLLSFVCSSDLKHSAAELGELVTLALVPMVVTMMDDRRWDRLLVLLAAVAAISSGLGLWEYAHGASSLEHRLNGLANHYMTFSGWTLVVILMLVGAVAFGRHRRVMWYLPVLLLCCVALTLSFTRGAWIGLASGVLLAVALRRPKWLLAVPLLAVALALILPKPVVERATSILDPRQHSNYDRICMARAGLHMIADNPLTGVGLGMVKPRYAEYRVADAPRERVPHLHNNIVQIAAERGLPGLAAYLAILVIFGMAVWHRLGWQAGSPSPVIGGCFLAVLGVTVAGLFEYNWGDSEIWIPTLVCLSVPFARVAGDRP
jgi:O-antigen ligase